MQNNRHLLEVFYPGGLHRLGDGWKLSMRLRFVHGRVRNLLKHSGTWDEATYGTPVSAAHLGLAMTVFSMRLLDYSRLTGALFNREEAASLMAVVALCRICHGRAGDDSLPGPRTMRGEFSRSATCVSQIRMRTRQRWRMP